MHVCVNIWVSSFLFVFHDLLPHWQSFSLCFFPFIFKSFFFMNHQFGFWVVLSKAFWHSDTITSLATVFVMLPLSHRRSSLSGKKNKKTFFSVKFFISFENWCRAGVSFLKWGERVKPFVKAFRIYWVNTCCITQQKLVRRQTKAAV